MIDSTAKIGAQKSAFGANAMNISWSRPANPAAFDGTDRNAATGIGAPSYVSGAQKWNGTLDTLNANPATTSRMAARAIDWSPALPDSALAMPSSLVVPVTPKIRLIPYSITALERTPIRKYFRPASLDFGSVLRNAAMRNPGADTSSSEMNSISRSRDDGMVRQPRKADSSS